MTARNPSTVGRNDRKAPVLNFMPTYLLPRCLASLTFGLVLSCWAVVHAQTEWQQELDSLRRIVLDQQEVITQQGRHLEAQQSRLDALENWPGYSPSSNLDHGNVVGYDGGFVNAGPGGDLVECLDFQSAPNGAAPT